MYLTLKILNSKDFFNNTNMHKFNMEDVQMRKSGKSLPSILHLSRQPLCPLEATVAVSFLCLLPEIF